MSLSTDLLPYYDKFDLIAPMRAGISNNDVLYTCEAVVLMDMRNELIELQAHKFDEAIEACMAGPGLLNRLPGGLGGAEAPDDYYGYAAYCAVIRRRFGWDIPAREVLRHGFTHFGSFNNVPPGKWSFNTWLWRQPQIMTAFIAASGMRWWERVMAFPLFLITALIIATSCRNVNQDNTDARRLAWLLIQAVAPESRMCRWAAKGWYARLVKDYGPCAMQGVASRYYEQGHPICAYQMKQEDFPLWAK